MALQLEPQREIHFYFIQCEAWIKYCIYIFVWILMNILPIYNEYIVPKLILKIIEDGLFSNSVKQAWACNWNPLKDERWFLSMPFLVIFFDQILMKEYCSPEHLLNNKKNGNCFMSRYTLVINNKLKYKLFIHAYIQECHGRHSFAGFEVFFIFLFYLFTLEVKVFFWKAQKIPVFPQW